MDTLHDTRQMPGFDEILADFAFLDDWEDRYRYVIELGRKLEPLAEAERSAASLLLPEELSVIRDPIDPHLSNMKGQT